MFRKKSKFYMKLLTVLSILGIIPVIILGIFSYMKAAESIQHNVEKEKEFEIYQTQIMMEQILKQIDQSLTNFSMSPLANQLLEEPLRANQFPLYRSLKQELNYIQQFDVGIQDIFFINDEHDWLIRNRGLKRITSYEDTYIESLRELPNRSTWVMEDGNNIPINKSENSCKRQLSMVKKLPLSSINNKGYMVALIPICNLQNKVISSQHLGTTLITTELNEIVYSKENEMFSNKQIIDLVEQRGRTGQFQTENFQETYTVTFRVSDYNGWTYINVVPLNELKNSSKAIGWFTIIVCLLIILFHLIVTKVISGKLYRPIQRLNKTIHSSIDTSDRDEFTRIEQHILSISKQNKDLEERSRTQKYRLNQFFVSKLIQGKTNKEEIKRNIEGHKEWNWFTVVAIQIDSLENSKFKPEDKDLLLFSINTIVEEIIEEKMRLTPTVYENKQVTLLHGEGTKNEYSEILHSHIEKLHQTIIQLLQIHVNIGISNHYEDIFEANRAFQESDSALRQSFLLGKNKIIYFDEKEVKYSFNNFYPKQLEHDLLEAMKKVDKETVNNTLDEMLDILLHEKQNYIQYEIAIIRLVTKLLETSELLSIEIKMANEPVFYHQLYQFTTKEQLEKWLKQTIIFPIMDNLKERISLDYRSIPEQIVHIIQKNLIRILH